MFDIGWSELLVVAVVAIVVIGPRDLPQAMRTLGRALGAVRRMASDFRGQFDDAMREAELDELRREIAGLRDIARGIVQQNDVGAIAQRELSDIRDKIDAKETVLEAKEEAAEEAKQAEIAAEAGSPAALPPPAEATLPASDIAQLDDVAAEAPVPAALAPVAEEGAAALDEPERRADAENAGLNGAHPKDLAAAEAAPAGTVERRVPVGEGSGHGG
jgi:sec-independent protein translocase protein TatB